MFSLLFNYILKSIKKMKEIDVNEIFQKLRTRADIKNFFREQGIHSFKFKYIIYIIYSAILS